MGIPSLPGVARGAWLGNQGGKLWGELDHGIDLGPNVTVGQVFGRLQEQAWARGLMDHVPDEVVCGLGETQLRTLHDHHLGHRAGHRKAVHDLAQVRGSDGSKVTRLWRALRVQLAEIV